MAFQPNARKVKYTVAEPWPACEHQPGLIFDDVCCLLRTQALDSLFRCSSKGKRAAIRPAPKARVNYPHRLVSFARLPFVVLLCFDLSPFLAASKAMLQRLPPPVLLADIRFLSLLLRLLDSYHFSLSCEVLFQPWLEALLKLHKDVKENSATLEPLQRTTAAC